MNIMALPKAKTLAVIKLALTINLKKKLQINKKRTGQRKLPGLNTLYSGVLVQN
jgi:hypothetical protein